MGPNGESRDPATVVKIWRPRSRALAFVAITWPAVAAAFELRLDASQGPALLLLAGAAIAGAVGLMGSRLVRRAEHTLHAQALGNLRQHGLNARGDSAARRPWRAPAPPELPPTYRSPS
jgi:hypothetical protein